MAAPDPAPRRPRAPSDYRPDVRPLLLLAVLLLVVVLGWVWLGPRILPDVAPAESPGALDGRWTLTPDAPLATTLDLRAGAYRLDGELPLTGAGLATVEDRTLTVAGHAGCEGTGRYAVMLGDVERFGLLPQFRAQSLDLEPIADPCSARVATLSGGTWILRASLRAGVHGICDPPNTEAAVTGHWPEPPGCATGGQ